MEERDKRRVGEQVEPGGKPKAPGTLELLQRFVNTWNHDLPVEWDRLGSRERASSWLVAKGLLTEGIMISGRDAARLRQFREAVRKVILAKHAVAPDAASLRTVREASSKATLHVVFDARGRTALEPARDGVYGAIATLLGILHEAQVSGAWSRFKACRSCGYAFYDRSKNRSASWCSMTICGNRAKNRAYRRHKSAASGGHSR